MTFLSFLGWLLQAFPCYPNPPQSPRSEGWIKSPGHRKNLEGAFDLCGIGALAHSIRFHEVVEIDHDRSTSSHLISTHDLYITLYCCIMIRLLKFLNSQLISGFWFQWSNAVGRIYEQISGWASLNFQTFCSWSILRHQSPLVASEGVWTFSDGHTLGRRPTKVWHRRAPGSSSLRSFLREAPVGRFVEFRCTSGGGWVC